MPIVEKAIMDDVEAVERITHLFKAERMVYLIATILAVIMLLASAAKLLFDNAQNHTPELVMLFGSSGLIGYATTRLLHMWDHALTFLKSEKEQKP